MPNGIFQQFARDEADRQAGLSQRRAAGSAEVQVAEAELAEQAAATELAERAEWAAAAAEREVAAEALAVAAAIAAVQVAEAEEVGAAEAVAPTAAVAESAPSTPPRDYPPAPAPPRPVRDRTPSTSATVYDPSIHHVFLALLGHDSSAGQQDTTVTTPLTSRLRWTRPYRPAPRPGWAGQPLPRPTWL